MMTVRKEFKGLVADIDTLRTVVIEQRDNVLCCPKCSNDGCTEKREAPAIPTPAIPTPAFPITDAYQKQLPAELMPVASLGKYRTDFRCFRRFIVSIRAPVKSVKRKT